MQLSVLDLFAGCGGLSLGLAAAGFNVVAACEKDKWAADSYEANHPGSRLLRADICELDNDFWVSNFTGSIDVVAGGPPCQGFSVSGKRQLGLVPSQNALVDEFLRIALLLKPPAILIENVNGFRTAFIRPGEKVLEYATRKLVRAGYSVFTSVLQAPDFGVPSLRSRFFLIALKHRHEVNPFPQPTYDGVRAPYLTVMDAISDLPRIEAGQGTDGPQKYPGAASSSYQRQMRKGSKAVYNHIAMNHTQRLVERFAAIPQGGSGFRFVQGGDDSQAVTVYKSNNQRLYADRPALCITANFQSTYIHPFLNRNLTAREAARLMTFPDGFIFKGKRTQMSSSLLKKEGRGHENYLSQYNQIGNAVPPRLAECVGRALRAALLRHRASRSSQVNMELAG